MDEDEQYDGFNIDHIEDDTSRSSLSGDEVEGEEGSSSNQSDGDDREPMDQVLPVQHLYMESTGTSIFPDLPDFVEPGTDVDIMIFLMNSVVVPFETIPITVNGVRLEDLRPYLVKGYVGFVSIKTDSMECCDVGVLAHIDRLDEHSFGFNLICTGRQRFRLSGNIPFENLHNSVDFSATYAHNVRVTVVPDVELGDVCQDKATCFNRLPARVRKRYVTALCGMSPFVVYYNETENYVRQLVKWLLRWFDNERLDKELSQGLTRFSFWLVQGLPSDMQTKLEFLCEDVVDKRLASQWSFARRLSLLACKNCGEVKSSVDDLVQLVSKGMSSNFVNRHGHVHNMFTSKTLKGRVLQGRPQTEYSWFPGYSWTICNCLRCGTHLGWLFQSKDKSPSRFYGIVRSALTAVSSNSTNDNVE